MDFYIGYKNFTSLLSVETRIIGSFNYKVTVIMTVVGKKGIPFAISIHDDKDDFDIILCSDIIDNRKRNRIFKSRYINVDSMFIDELCKMIFDDYCVSDSIMEEIFNVGADNIPFLEYRQEYRSYMSKNKKKGLL